MFRLLRISSVNSICVFLLMFLSDFGQWISIELHFLDFLLCKVCKIDSNCYNVTLSFIVSFIMITVLNQCFTVFTCCEILELLVIGWISQKIVAMNSSQVHFRVGHFTSSNALRIFWLLCNNSEFIEVELLHSRPLLVIVIQAVLIFVNIIININIMELEPSTSAFINAPHDWGSESKIYEVKPESQK